MSMLIVTCMAIFGPNMTWLFIFINHTKKVHNYASGLFGQVCKTALLVITMLINATTNHTVMNSFQELVVKVIHALKQEKESMFSYNIKFIAYET